ncbi:MAG: double-strand break repair protein AddB, partial [Sphingomonadaceae bacterium]
MAERKETRVYSIAAHRGFADSLAAGLVAKYGSEDLGIARLTLLLPSSRTKRTVTEAFIRLAGYSGQGGLLMPRMAVVGDLDIDEALGPLLDPMGASSIPSAIDPTYRWLRLASILRTEMGDDAPGDSILMRMARDYAATMDRLLAEEVAPEDLLSEQVVSIVDEQAHHWKASLRRFARVQAFWLAELRQKNRVDAATRRNLLFDHIAAHWREKPPQWPVIAAGVTSAAPALARLLRVISHMENGTVILPDFDLGISKDVWQELGQAGAGEYADDPPFGKGDAVTHPQYHLKLLLNRMGVHREEVRPWHRKGLAAAKPDRSHALSCLFLPPEASKSWVELDESKRRLAGLRIMQCATLEEEAQSVALLVREALSIPEKRVAVVTPDRDLAGRVARHLQRWNIIADDSAGKPLAQTPAGRLVLLLAECVAEQGAPVSLMALLQHPLVKNTSQADRAEWLRGSRKLELVLRGPRHTQGLQHISVLAEKHGLADWWRDVISALEPLILPDEGQLPLADMLERLIDAAERLGGENVWSHEDGRDAGAFLADLGMQARSAEAAISVADFAVILRDAMDGRAVRPAWGGHPRIAIYGLLESRMSRADLVICAGLNEGTWPAPPAQDPLLAPPVMRALGIPGTDFRIGLSAHDLAGAMGTPEVILSRSARDMSGPTIPSRFLLRVEALMGGRMLGRQMENTIPQIARRIDWSV